MRLVFVGINPSPYSVQRGHYFARPTSRFWSAFSASRLSAPLRSSLGRDRLTAEDDLLCSQSGVGFTDVVKRPTSSAALLRPKDFAVWTPDLRRRLEAVAPRALCFHGTMAFRPFLRYGLGSSRQSVDLGPQPERLDGAAIFVVPNPSPANAHATPSAQRDWYDRVADFLDALD